MSRLGRLSVCVVLLALFIATVDLSARSRRSKPSAEQPFDYYLLTLSWAPEFCAMSGSTDPGECGTGRHVAYVVHGLWPQGNTGRGPENCGNSQVPHTVVDATLPYIPTAGLIFHEWKTHGTCTGLPVDVYFATVRKARDSVKIPTALTSLAQSETKRPSDVEALFAAANPSFPPTAFRATCSQGQLSDTRICFTKGLQAIACPASAGTCNSPSITILPPR